MLWNSLILCYILVYFPIIKTIEKYLYLLPLYSSMKKTLEQISSETDTKLETGRLSGPIYILYDTGAILKMYDEIGDRMFDLPSGYVGIIPQEVVAELENQHNTKRTNDDGSILCPYQLMNGLYIAIGMEKVIAMPLDVTDEQKNIMIESMLANPDNTKANSRIGSGDAALIEFANIFSDSSCIVVTCDSDLDMLKNGMSLSNTVVYGSSDYRREILN